MTPVRDCLPAAGLGLRGRLGAFARAELRVGRGLFVLALGLVIVGAVQLRVGGLERSLWYDELFSLVHFMRGSALDALSRYKAANNHLFHSFLATLARALPGLSETAAVRLPALLLGLAGLALLGLAARLRLGRREALIALALGAVLPGHALYCVESRGYAGAATATLLVLVLTTLPGGRLRDRALVVAITLGLWLHATTLLPFFGILALLLWRTFREDQPESERADRRRLLVHGAIGLGVALLAYLRVLKRVVSFAKRNVLTGDIVEVQVGGHGTGIERLGAMLTALGPWDAEARGATLLTLALLVLALHGGRLLWRQDEAGRRLAGGTLAAALVTLVFWMLPGTLFFPRFVLLLQLPVLLLALRGLTDLADRTPTPRATLLSLTLAAVLLLAPTAERVVRQPGQPLAEAVALAQSLPEARLAATGTGAELLGPWRDLEIPVLNTVADLEAFRSAAPERPTALIVPFAEALPGELKARLAGARVQRLRGLRADSLVIIVPARRS